MDELDEIIIRDLRDHGCAVPEDYRSMKDFKADVICSAVLRCLRIVDQQREYPRQLPKATIQKVNQTTQLANRIKELGFQGELSYHNLLYPNEADTRRLFMWFQELLPKQDEKPGGGREDKSSILNKAIEEEIIYLQSDKCFWLPVFANSLAQRQQYFFNAVPLATRELCTPATSVYYKGFQRKTPDLDKYFDQYQPLVTDQPLRPLEVGPSILEYNTSANSDQVERENEWNTLGLESGLNPMEYLQKKKQEIKDRMISALRSSLDRVGGLKRFVTSGDVSTRFGRAVRFGQELEASGPSETEEEIEQRREKERAEADARYKAIVDEVKDTESKIQAFLTEMRQIKAMIQAEAAKTEDLKRKYLQIKTVMELLDDPEGNIEKLKRLAQQNSETLKKLAADWEKVRVPLVEQYRLLRDKLADREVEAKQQLEKIKEMRAKMKELIDEINVREDKYKQLLDMYKKLPKDNRSNYTRRILDMVKNVKKQIVEINKILIDTKNLQKDINTVTDTLNRSFAVAEELVFQDAPKDPVAATIYKKIASMNESFNHLIEAVEQAGTSRNDSMTLEEKIAKITQRTSALNMESIEQDLTQVRAENAKLLLSLRDKERENPLRDSAPRST